MTTPPLEPGALSILRDIALVALSAPSADNSQPLDLDFDDGELACYYTQRAATGPLASPSGHALLMNVGALFENLQLLAERSGVAPPVLTGAYERTHPYLRWRVPTVDRMDPSFSADILARHTNRFAFRKTPPTRASIQPVAAARVGAARVLWVDARPTLDRLAATMLTAANVRFQTRELHDWLMQSLRFSDAAARGGDGLDVRTLALPPLGAATMRFLTPWSRMDRFNRLGGYRMFAAVEAAALRRGPVVVAIVAPRTDAGTIDAGRLSQQVWIRLHQQELGVQPQYAITDQLVRLHSNTVPSEHVSAIERVAQSMSEVLAVAPDEFVHMLFRVGQPGRIAPRSLRLPLEQTCRWLRP